MNQPDFAFKIFGPGFYQGASVDPSGVKNTKNPRTTHILHKEVGVPSGVCLPRPKILQAGPGEGWRAPRQEFWRTTGEAKQNWVILYLAPISFPLAFDRLSLSMTI